jgi:hypothetical protein
MSDSELNPHNHKEGRYKYPINHKGCERTIYFYKHKLNFGDIPCFEYTQRISLEQPIPEVGANAFCPHCKESVIPYGGLTIDEAREMK